MKTVTCVDLQGKTYEVPADELSFRPSVYAIIIRDGKILLSRTWDGYDLPGGGINLGERTEDALKREVKEETGFDVSVDQLMAARNSFFKTPFKGKFRHSILLYYLCTVTGGEASSAAFSDQEKEYMKEPEWVELSKIRNIKFYSSVDVVNIIENATR